MSELLYDFWYVACHGATLKPGALQKVTLLGEALIVGRADDGKVFALRDFCPHRGIPLSYGRFDGKEIECCYHGWRFGCDGVCTSIPSLTQDDTTDISRIRAASFPCREQEGLVWVYVPTPKTRAPENLPDIPRMPGPENKQFKRVDSVHLPCNIDHAVIGLMDPSHGPFVHRAWWWRSTRSIHSKQKHFAPHGLGFKMVAHTPSSNSRAYKILGGAPMTEIAFALPGLRTEHIRVGNKHISLLTALSPVDEKNTVLHQFIYSDMTLVNTLLPLLMPFGKAFIQQDVRVVKMQQEGLRDGHPSLMLLGDADQQALWYFKLKRTMLDAKQAGSEFINPLREKTLRWRS